MLYSCSEQHGSFLLELEISVLTIDMNLICTEKHELISVLYITFVFCFVFYMPYVWSCSISPRHDLYYAHILLSHQLPVLISPFKYCFLLYAHLIISHFNFL